MLSQDRNVWRDGMMAKKSKRPSWFKLWLHHRPLIDAVPDEVAGRAVKAALHYFATGEVMHLGQLETVVFASIKSDIDDAHADYLRDVENGKKGGRPKMTQEDKPPVRGGNPSVPTVTEGEGEGERDGEEDGKGIKADKPPTRHKYGSYKNVLFTDEEYAKLQAEYPTDYSERIERLSEYIASTGKSYKSHLATIRSWARKDGAKAGAMPSYGGEENWSL